MPVEEGMANEVPQGRMVIPAKEEEPGEKGVEDGKMGGEIYTCQFSEEETRTPELHGALRYQETTADPGVAPPLKRYTELTEAVED